MCVGMCVSVFRCCSWDEEGAGSQLGLAGELRLQVLGQLIQELEGVQVVGSCHAANIREKISDLKASDSHKSEFRLVIEKLSLRLKSEDKQQLH